MPSSMRCRSTGSTTSRCPRRPIASGTRSSRRSRGAPRSSFQEGGRMADPKVDMEKFRLRGFVKKLAEMGELETVERAVSFTELAKMVEDATKALHFKQVGPDKFEMISGVL